MQFVAAAPGRLLIARLRKPCLGHSRTRWITRHAVLRATVHNIKGQREAHDEDQY